VADTSAARAALADSLHLLRAELESAGVRTSSLEVGHREQARHQRDARPTSTNGGHPGADHDSVDVIDLRRRTTDINAAIVSDGRLDVRI
jgi:hypothetical protein